MTLVCLCLIWFFGLCLFGLYGNCLLLLFTLGGNIVEVGEDIEVVDQEYQVQETFEQGNLPPNLQLCLYFGTIYTSKIFWKKNKTLSPMCDKIFCHTT